MHQRIGLVAVHPSALVAVGPNTLALLAGTRGILRIAVGRALDPGPVSLSRPTHKTTSTPVKHSHCVVLATKSGQGFPLPPPLLATEAPAAQSVPHFKSILKGRLGLVGGILSWRTAPAMAANATSCAHCGKQGVGFKRCSRCKDASYCGAECQNANWKRHKKTCSPPLSLNDVIDHVNAAHAAGDWQGMLKLEGRFFRILQALGIPSWYQSRHF
jgi:hypothetical protein